MSTGGWEQREWSPCRNRTGWFVLLLPGGDAAVGVGGCAAVDALVAWPDLADEESHLAARRVERHRVLGAVRHVARVCKHRADF